MNKLKIPTMCAGDFTKLALFFANKSLFCSSVTSPKSPTVSECNDNELPINFQRHRNIFNFTSRKTSITLRTRGSLNLHKFVLNALVDVGKGLVDADWIASTSAQRERRNWVEKKFALQGTIENFRVCNFTFLSALLKWVSLFDVEATQKKLFSPFPACLEALCARKSF